MIATKKETAAAFKKRMGTITVPEGFTTRFEEQPTFRHEVKQLAFILEKMNGEKLDVRMEFRHEYGDGTTTFSTAHGERTFDRTGVESSFYHRLFGNEAVDLDAMVKEQLGRIEERRTYLASSIQVPVVKYRIQPEDVARYRSQLKKRGVISFMPSGFGTGYTITTKPVRKLRHGEKRATPELEMFFGVSPLYISTMDCD